MTDICKVFMGIDKSDFHDAFSKFKRDIILSVLNDDVQYYQYLNKDNLLSDDVFKMGIFSRCPDNVKEKIIKIINGGNEFRVSILTMNLIHYELYIVICNDKPIVTPDGKECDAYSMTAKYKIDEEADDFITQFMFLSNKSIGYKNENRYHIIVHEIVHLVLGYLREIKNIDGDTFELIDKLGCEEFLADFLPFYMVEGMDFINNFLLYGKKWFKEDIFKNYKEYIKQLIPYFNMEN